MDATQRMGTEIASARPQPGVSVEVLFTDMNRPPDDLPRGAEMHGWAGFPRINLGHTLPKGWSHGIATGMIYTGTKGHRGPVDNVRVQVRRLTFYVLRRSTMAWSVAASSPKLEGANYVENFAQNANRPADLRDEASGGWSATVPDGYNFHFWTGGGRRGMPIGDIAGAFSIFEARLIPADRKGPDQLDNAHFVGAASADYWRSKNARWVPDFSNNDDVAIGRFKVLTRNWRIFSMNTLGAGIRDIPPPLALSFAIQGRT